MEIKLTGDFTVQKSAEDVYRFLVDPNRFCPLLPDFQSMEILDPANFLVRVKVGISHIRGVAAIKMTLVEQQNAKHAVYEGRGEVPGGSTTIRAHFQLEDAPGGHTKVIWSGESSVLGRIISLSGGLLEPLGKKSVQKLIDGLQKALA